MNVEGRDIIAAIALIGAFILLTLGVDSEVKAVPAFILGFYFASKIKK